MQRQVGERRSPRLRRDFQHSKRDMATRKRDKEPRSENGSIVLQVLAAD